MITSEPIPPPTSPRATWMASATRPKATAKIGVAQRDRCSLVRATRAGSARVGMEDLLDGVPEEAGDGDGKRQRGAVAVGLDGVDRLPGDPEHCPQLCLGQALAGS